MNERRAKALRGVAEAAFPSETAAEQEYLPRKALRKIVGFGNGPITRLVPLPIRLAPGRRHIYKQLKREYLSRGNKKLPVRFHPREGW